MGANAEAHVERWRGQRLLWRVRRIVGSGRADRRAVRDDRRQSRARRGVLLSTRRRRHRPHLRRRFRRRAVARAQRQATGRSSLLLAAAVSNSRSIPRYPPGVLETAMIRQHHFCAYFSIPAQEQAMTIKAYGAYAAEKPLEPMDIVRRKPGARDVQIEIAYCGV